MLKHIISFCIRNKLVVMVATLVLIIAGTYATITLPTDAVPDITNNQVQVVTISPTLAPQEVEQLITFPVELSMLNVVGVSDIRSVSRFGLSVVTVVFYEDVPILQARQMIGEKISEVASEMPAGLGTPQMMPITTGLGEIFQYTLTVDSAYRDKYSITELRTIQDWIVKRQLSGINGVVEISSFGGKLKQYEVSVDPEKMMSLNISIAEIYDALSRNNQNTGGSYIEKYNKAYYIRSEGMISSLADIENIVIGTKSDTPILIKDVAAVVYGSAPRFGAMTRNGEGECVGGITLMLKGANASDVTQSVLTRVESVQKMLPEGVNIEPYLIRSALVERNMGTVIKNLTEGAIIVFLVLIIFLGNVRIGLIVASIIPLAMLFAFIMMHLFGVTANLMSLGAIDFGIVIDGTIILVESVVAALLYKMRGKTLTQLQLDTLIVDSTGAIAKSAIFSVLIILIVFFPILSLTGIEGKTFQPMAKTLIFAIIGAMILSITYIPVMLSMFVKKRVSAKENISDKIIGRLKVWYAPLLNLVLRRKIITLMICVAIFFSSVGVFMQMGGEFMPVLDEGDFAMQMTLPPGSSLTESIEISTRAEKLLLSKFPEVKSVVSKIGTAEVPTDPMGVEDADIMIVMKPFEEWTSAKSRAEIVEKMKKELEVVTGASFTFSQPIQLRFNELMTGSKADIAVKLYGEDMEELYARANEVAALIETVDGPSDIIVEQAVGLPQLVVKYNREAMARNSLSIEDVNTVIRSSFAGESAGQVFEGERRFDLVVRNNKQSKKDLNLSNLFVKNGDGMAVSLSEVADVEYVSGPMQINRDQTKRRIVIGVNVRNADVESVVGQIQAKIDSNIKLKPGYYFTYGGQFENLKNAKSRLSIVIPLALFLIMVLLYFTFNSMKYAVLIFSTVPLSVTGGIFALYLRGIPFSISAGVGFIALFGVAVLNGIVMINHYKHMAREEKSSTEDIVKYGSMELLRPVLMTGLVASLGFVPMAISTSAGSEMQRPLATVVIGGLLLSTILTLIVIPILYMLFNRKKRVGKGVAAMVAALVLSVSSAEAQSLKVTVDDVVSMAIENSPRLKNAALEIERQQKFKSQVTSFGSTEVVYDFGQLNGAYRKDYEVGVTQSLGSLLTPFYENKRVNHQIKSAEIMSELVKKEVVAEVKRAWYNYLNRKHILNVLTRQVGYYEKLANTVKKSYEVGYSTLLEKNVAELQFAQIKNRQSEAQIELQNSMERLKWFAYSNEYLESSDDDHFLTPDFELMSVGTSSQTLYARMLNNQTDIARSGLKVERSKFFPELSVGYRNQMIFPLKGLQTWNVGVSIPIFFWQQKSRVAQSKISVTMAENSRKIGLRDIDMKILELTGNLRKSQNNLFYYTSKANPQAQLISKSIERQYSTGQINVVEMLQSLLTVCDTELGFYNTLLECHIAMVEIEMYQY